MSQQIGEVAAMATAVLWTLSALAWTSAGQRIGAVAVSFMRLVVALAPLMLLCYFTRGRAWPVDASPRTWAIVGISGFLGFCVSDLCQFKSFLLMGPRLTLLITCSLTPPMTVFVSAIYCRLWPLHAKNVQVFGLHSWIGMSITLGGVLWVLMERRAGDDQSHTRDAVRHGIVLSLVAIVVQSVAMVLAKQGMPNDDETVSNLTRIVGDGAAMALIRIVGAAIGYAAVLTFAGRWPSITRAAKNGRAMAILASGTIVGPFLGVTTLMIAFKGIHEGVVTTVLATIPVLILPFSIFLYREQISIRALAGALIAAAGVAVLMWPL